MIAIEYFLEGKAVSFAGGGGAKRNIDHLWLWRPEGLRREKKPQ